MTVFPIGRKEANAYVNEFHRHLGGVHGFKFAVKAIADEGTIGVAIAGRPLSRTLDDGLTLEITRCCTDGTRNACSFLHGAIRRAAKALGYQKLVTYTLPEEGGASLKASGWTCKGEAGGGTWNTKSRPRVDKHSLCKKLRWELAL
jgi:hypothetical protein